MEILRKNFREALPLISESIEKADFLVIDTEFTGLINGRDVSIFDTPKEYYIRLLNGSTEFLLIQFGLCAFYWDEEKKHYMNDTYNFFLFPRGRPGPEKLFMSQSASLDFLASQGFDFNKLIREGISYMTESVESRLRENLVERQKTYSREKDIINIPEEHKAYIDIISAKVQDFIDKKESNEMEIDRCNAFVRLLLYQELRLRFKGDVVVETKVLENKTRVLMVRRITSENDAKNLEVLRKEKEWDDLEDAVGFSKVARMISQSRKLVIGHNMLLDVLHTLNHFFQPLPPDYGCFKEFTHCIFPMLLDTKYMSSLPPFKDKVNSSVLVHLLNTLSEAPFSLPKVDSVAGRGYQLSEGRQHEAGFDAFATGMCFLAMHAHLARMRGEPAGRIAPHNPALKPFINKLFLAKTAHHESPYMNLNGPDPSPSRDHMFHLTFPKEWLRQDINQLFSPFGPVTVQFIDDSSAMIALTRREQARDVTRVLARNSRIMVLPYAKYKDMGKPDFSPEKVIRDPKPAELTTTILKTAHTPDPKHRYVAPNASPTKVTRIRSNSVKLPEPVARPPRKRTSSGVYQVDESEPPSKKAEPVRSQSEGTRTDTNPPDSLNGRRKVVESAESDKAKLKEKTKEKKTEKVIQTFDSEAKTKCVSAFKESDSWD